jgi:4-amino-4-deoxy-L-arabinose transferase-like glycosyltransferase
MTTARRRSLAVVCLALLWIVWVCLHTFTVPVFWRPHPIDHPLGPPVFWREALARTVRAIAGALLVGAAAWQFGGMVMSRATGLAAGDEDDDLWQIRSGVGVVTLSCVLLALSWVGAYRRPIVAAVVIGTVVLWHPVRLLSESVLAVRRAAQWVWRLLRGRSSLGASDIVLLAVAAAAIGCAAIAALAPETESDALWYHLWLPTQWLDAGHLVDIVEEYISLYPGGWELLNGAALTLGGPVAAKLLQWACLPLTGLATCRLVRRAVPTVRPSIVFAIAVISPVVIWEGSTAYVDLALAWLLAVSALALLRFDATSDRRWLLIGGVLMGGALGVKHLGLIVLALFTLLLLARRVTSSWWRDAVVPAVLVVAVAFVLASPWYVRAARASGNPVFPEMYRIFGARPETRWSTGSEEALGRFKARFGMGHSPSSLARLPLDLTEHPARFGGTLGPVFLAFVPLAFSSRYRRRVAPAAIVCAGYFVVWASPLGSLQLRFLVPIVPFLTVLASAGVDALFAAAAAASSALAVLPIVPLTAMLIMNLPPFVQWQERDRVGWNGWLTHVLHGLPVAVAIGAESEEAYLTRTVPTYAAWKAIAATTPHDSRVLTFVSGDHLYGTRARLWSDTTMAYPITWGATAGHERDALAAARRFGITHVLMDRKAFGDPEFDALAFRSPAMAACCLTPIFDDGRVIVSAVRYPGDRDGPASLVSRR